MIKKHHPQNRRERMQLEAAKKERNAKKESAYVRRRTSELEEKEAEDAIREEANRETR